MSLITFLIPVFNGLNHTKICLENIHQCIEKSAPLHRFQVVLIDDGSTDGTATWVRTHYKTVHIVSGDGNLWWTGAINLGARYALEELHTDYVILWNNDVVLSVEYMNNLSSILKEYSSDTLLGSKIYADARLTTVWSMGGYFNRKSGKFGMIGYFEPDGEAYRKVCYPDWLAGMGTILHRSVIEKTGYWNQKDFPQYFGDSDYTLRARESGLSIVVDPRLILWNDTTNTGLKHQGDIKKLIRMFTDKKSLYYFHANLKFLQLHTSNPLAYFNLFKLYFYLVGGFIKSKLFRKTS
jgi:GT2 family glycosyltransferase